MVTGRFPFVSSFRRPISLLNCLLRGRRKRQNREKRKPFHLASSYSTAEQLEDRTLLAGASLVNIEPNMDIALTDGEIYNEAPKELTFKFTPGQAIDPATLSGIQIVRSGLDGTFTDGNEVIIQPGYIGIGENPNEVIVRFAESLPDDHFQITIFGTGATPLLNQTGDAFQDGEDQVINFELDLGAKIVSVVTQPVLRDQILRISDVSEIQDGDTFTITAGGASATFEMDLNGDGVTEGNIDVDLDATDTESDIATAIETAFISSGSPLLTQATITQSAITPNELNISGKSASPRISFLLVDPSNSAFERSEGGLNQILNQVDVYFNDDPLDPISAQNPLFYQLIDTATNTIITPDAAVNPVVYNAAENKVTLTFAAPIADGTYHLRIGESATPDFETSNVFRASRLTDDNSSFATASDLGTLDSQTIQINAQIEPQAVAQPPLPGGNDEPGHREITIEQHIGSTGTTPSNPGPIGTVFFSFPETYGTDLFGNILYNEITENQKQRTREIYEIYSYLSGIEVQEVAAGGTRIVTGDIRALEPAIPPLAAGGIAGGGTAIMNGALDWGDSPYGGGWFVTAFHEIGHTLGLEHSYDLPSIMGSSGGDVGGTVPGEPIFPSNHDIVHINRIRPNLANDIDLHKFELPASGRFTAEILADRLPTVGLAKSFLDSVLTLYRENSDGSREIIARNDDYFGEDSFLDLELEAGTYYLAVTSVGNTNFDPTVADSGYGGRTDGEYRLNINFDFAALIDNGFSTDEESVLNRSFFTDNGSGVDSDLDTNDSFTVTAVAGGAVGSQFALSSGALLTVNADGTFSYDPNGVFTDLALGETDTDNFTYTITDSQGATDTATVIITINGLNDDPVANNDAFDLNNTGTFTGNVLLNNGNGADSDTGSNDILTVSQVDGLDTVGSQITLSSGALLTVNSDGSFLYDTNGQFDSLTGTATDSFSYQISDGNGGFDTALVTLTLSDDLVPIANLDSVSTTEDVVLNNIDVLSNDTDPDGNDANLTVSGLPSSTSALGATLSLLGNTINYDPTAVLNYLAAGQTVTDTFTYTLQDENGRESIGTVTVTVTGVNDSPIAQDDVFTINEDTPTPTSGSILANNGNGVDSDPDTNDIFTVTAVNGLTTDVGTQITLASGALLTVNADGSFSYDPNGVFEDLALGDTDSDSFAYTITDLQGGTDTATVTITIDGVNDPPVAQDDLFTTDEDTMTGGNVLSANPTTPDSDVETQAISVIGVDAGLLGTSVTLASGALLTLNAGGTFSYDPNGAFEYLSQGETDTDSFNYRIYDGNGGTDTATVTILVTGVNDDPVAQDDAILTDEDSSTNGSLFANNGSGVDSDPDTNDSFIVTAVDGLNANVGTPIILASGALLTVNADGTFSYDPNGVFESLALGDTATESFTYTITDTQGATDTATVNVTINGVNDAPDAQNDAFTIDEDTIFTGGNVLSANDSDTEGQAFTVTAVAGGTVGTQFALSSGALLTLNTDGTFIYDTNGQFEDLEVGDIDLDNFTYTITDTQGATDTATVIIGIVGVNDAPIAQDDAFTTDEDTILTGENVRNTNPTTPDSDVEGQSLTVSEVDGIIANVGTQITLTSGALLTVNAFGTFDYDPNGVFTDLALGETSTDSFTYTIRDSQGGTDTATVTITINGVNDPPIAQDDANAVNKDNVFNGNVLSNNGSGADSDPDTNDTITVNAVAGGTVGSQFTLGSGALLTVNADGTFSYDPNGQFATLTGTATATDTFDYTISDGNGELDTATVTLTISENLLPVANSDTGFSTNEDTALIGGDLFADNGSGVDSGDSISVSEVNDNPASVGSSITLASGALLTVNADGTFDYDPNGAFDNLAVGDTSTDSFIYTITDTRGATDTATATITITGLNDRPIAENDTFTTDEDTALTGGNVFNANLTMPDSDAEGQAITVTEVNGLAANVDTQITLASGAFLIVNADGSFSYNPNDAFESLSLGDPAASDSFTYTITDTQGATDTATVNVTINGVNDPPVALGDLFITNEDTMTGGNVFNANPTPDFDVEGQAISVIGVDAGPLGTPVTLASGAVLILNADGTFSYDPNGAFEYLSQGETDIDSFTYRIYDGNGGTDTAIVTMLVTGVNDDPVAQDDAILTDEDSSTNGSLFANNGSGVDNDPDTNDSFIVTAVAGGTVGSQFALGSGALLTVNADGTFSYDPNGVFESLALGDTATESFTYTITDTQGATDTATVNVTINGVNDPPVARDDAFTTDEDTALTGGNVFNANPTTPDSDVEGQAFTVTAVAGGTVGTPFAADWGLGLLTLNADGTFTYDPNGQFEDLAAGESYTENFQYTITDIQGAISTATITIIVNGVNDDPVANDDPANNTILFDETGTGFDGDADGTPGGVFDFWFTASTATNTIFVDKTAPSTGADGSLTNPFSNIEEALNQAKQNNETAAGTTQVVRIVGNGGTDGDIDTIDDNEAYLVGLDDFFQPLEDGGKFDIPKDVTVMIDAGTIIKLQNANIEVGSNDPLLLNDRSGGALQILGTPDNQVYLTSYGNDAIGGDDDGLSDGANAADWGGIVFRADSDLEEMGIFLNSVNNADISFGGGSVFVNSVLQTFSAIHAESARPTIWYNSIHNNADSAISADPRSFEDSRFVDGSFIMDRYGLEIFDNHINDNSINGLFVRINTEFGDTINKLDVPGIFNDDITHVITENLQIYGAPGGQLVDGSPSINGRLKIDPGIVVKLSGSRIEAERGSAQLIAEGTEENPIIFTSLSDDRYGAGTTFDTSNDGVTAFGPGNWGGIIFNAASSGSIDHALITNAGGLVPIEGDLANFNAIEVHQAELRLTNSTLENNASGQTGSSRNGRGSNASATIFVRGAQPVIVDNIFQDNAGTVISIDANALSYKFMTDYGRSTGFIDAYQQYPDNHGALVRLNRMENNGLNGMEVRPALLDTETVWDDTDIVHILRGEILVNQHHTFSGIRLQSNLDEGLVVKLDGPTAGFTADGVPLDIDDRIGGTVQIIGQPGFPVVLTSLADDTVGASFTPDGFPQTDTNNDGNASTPSAGDWRSIRLDRYSNDRNVVVRFETEGNNTNGVDVNDTAGFAQNLGVLAPDEISGDENRALGFEVHGNISADAPDDVDVYSFNATAGTRIWVDIDRTSSALDTVVELIDIFGNVLASSLDSFNLGTLGGTAQELMQTAHLLGDFYSQNKGDAGFSVILPGPTDAVGTYFVRVRSQPVVGDEANVSGGQTSGQYQLQIRLRQVDEKPGSTVRHADIRFATNGVEVLGQPSHSPLLGESSEKTGDNDTIDNAQGLGNLLTSDRNTLAVSGTLSNDSDVDWYTFEMGYDLIQVIGGLSDGGKTFSTIFDIDYADGLTRADTTLSVFDDQGRLILVSRDSDIEDDQSNGDTEDLSSGSFGKLDPYIGSTQLPADTPGSTFRYHVAISSNLRLPQALNATFNAGALNSQIRLEPVSSVQRIVEDHIGFSGYTSGNELAGGTAPVDPTTPSIFDITDTTTLSANVSAFTLADVNLYVSQGDRLRIADAYDGRVVDSVDGAPLPANTIDVGALSTGSPTTADITIRSDGRLYSYENLPGVANTAGRLRELNAGNGATVASFNDGIPNIITTAGAFNDPVRLTTDSVGALAFQRTGVATYNLFYAVNDPAGFTTLYQGNPANGDAGDNRVISSTNSGDSGNTFTVLGDIPIIHGRVTGMSYRGINASASQSQLYAVTDTGQFLTINQSGGTRRDVTSVTAVDLSGQISGTFTGLTAAPQNLNNGAFQNFLFAITDSGNLYAIDPATGTILSTVNDPVLGTIDIFSGGGTSINVGATGVTGLAFSPLDFNLWHPTFQRNSDEGHGINNTFDQTRTDVGGNSRDTFPGNREHSEQQGGASFYFGFEQWLQNNDSTNDYIDYVESAQYGVLSSNFQRDLSSNPDIGDNYNIAGGAHGSLESGEFSLAGYSATDLPTLYFNYFLETQNANSLANGMRDAARVFIFNNNSGNWEELATNNSTLAPATDPDSGELSSYISTSEREGANAFGGFNANQQVQELFDNSGVWRQARVDLGSYAGQSNLRLRFDFSTSGTISSDIDMPGDIFGNPISNQQAQNNDFEGFYIDDIIIGFAERGELVTGAQANQTDFFNVPQNPTFGAPIQLLSGAYQLEIRRGTDYAAPPNDQLPDLIIFNQLDTNDRLIREDGQLGDRNLERQQGHISIESNTITSASEYGINIDAGLRESVAAGPNGGVTARSQAGGVINGPTLNDFFTGGLGFAPGVTVQNNVITEFVNGLGGLRISGDANSSDANNPAAVSYTKVVNNTLVGANVEVTQSSAQIDVVFVIDVSGTMGSAIANVQTQILGFDAQMQAAGIDAQYGLVIFPSSTNTDPGLVQDIVDFATFTAPGSPFQNIPIQGATERGSDAILEALNQFDPAAGPTTFNFRPGSRIVPILLTDEDDDSDAQSVIDAQAALLTSNALLYAVANPGEGNTDNTYGVLATSTGGSIFDIDDFLLDPTAFFATMTTDLIGQIAVGASGQGIVVENFATTTILNNIIANTAVGIDLQSATGIPNVVGANLFKGNSNNGTTGSNAILLGADDPLFVNPNQGNFYLADNSQAIDSSLNSLSDRPDFIDVKDAIGMPNSDIFAPTYDTFGQLRVDDPTQTPPPGLGSNIFKDRGAIERADFVGPTAIITLPADNDLNGVDLNPSPTEVFIYDPELFTTMIIELRDSGIGIDDSLVNSLQFTVTAETGGNTSRVLEEGVDYLFSYNSNTNEAIFTAAAGIFDLDTLYTITVDNSDVTGVKDLAGNSLQPNQQDGVTTSFKVGVADADNNAPVNLFNGTSISDPGAGEVDLGLVTDYATDIVFSEVAGNVLSVSDSDAFLGSGDIEVTLSTIESDGITSHGTLTLGTTFVNVTEIILTGSVDEVNAQLKEVIWSPDLDFFSADTTLTMTTNDNENFDGSVNGDNQGAKEDVDIIKITVNEPPVITFDMNTYQVDENGGSVTVTLTRDTVGLAATVIVELTDIDTVPDDFDTFTNPIAVNFGAGDLTQTFTIPINDDDIIELDEQFLLTINSITGGTIDTNNDEATVTIVEDTNDTADIIIEAVSGSEASNEVVFRISLTNSKEVAGTFSVLASTINGGTATSGVDFTAKSETITFSAGETEKFFTITVDDDDIVELGETVFAQITNLINPDGYDIEIDPTGGDTATGTILDNDSANIIIEAISGSESSRSLIYKVSLSQEVAGTIEVDASTILGGTGVVAIPGVDYTAKTETITFNAGVTEQFFTVVVDDDQIVELDETVRAQLSNLTNPDGYDVQIDASGNDIASGTILDNDSAVVSIQAVSGSETSQQLIYKVSLSKEVAGEISVIAATIAGGTATIGDDFTSNSETITFATGETTKFFTVDVVDDQIAELNETVDAQISGLTNLDGFAVTIDASGDDTATGTIVDNDVAIIEIQPQVSTGINEGTDVGQTTDFTFLVNISKQVDADISFNISTQDGTSADPAFGNAMTADNDYIQITDQLFTFDALDQTQQEFVVSIPRDRKVELDEIFGVIMSNLDDAGRNVVFANATAEGTILNDDSAELTINSISELESNGPITFTVTLSNPVDTAVSVGVLTIDGTALVADNDYTPIASGDPNQVLTFDVDGPLTQKFTVDVNNDNTVEADELFSVIFESGSLESGDRDVTTVIGGGEGTIRNDDTATFSITPVIDTEDNSPFRFLVELSNPVDIEITVDASIVPGSAELPADISLVSNPTMTFGPNDNTPQYIVVDIVQDGTPEGPETFDVRLDNVQIADDRAVFLTSIVERGSSATSDAALAIDVVGDFAFIADRDDGLQVFNISDPSSPVNVGSYDFNQSGFVGVAQGIDVVGNFAYIAVGQAGLQILNISDPTNPSFVGSFATTARARNVQVIGNLAYVVDDSGNGGGLQIVDVTDPANPAPLGSFSTTDPGGLAGGVKVVGNIAYVTDGVNGLRIVDVSDPDPVGGILPLIQTVNLFGETVVGLDVDEVNGFAYVVTWESGLHIIDISDAANGNAAYESSFGTNGIATDVRVVGDFAYIADGAHGLQVINISDPMSPEFANMQDTPGNAIGLFVEGTLAFIADSFSGFQILEFSPSTSATGIILDPSGAPLIGTASANTTISTSLVLTPTSTDSNGETNAVPESEEWIDEWSGFWVEVWGNTSDGSGISGGTFDLEYNTDYFTATAVEYGSAFSNSSSATIDDQTGIVSGVTGQNNLGTLGSGKQVLLARVRFESLSDDEVIIDQENGFLGPHNLGIRVLNSQLDISDFGGVTATVADSPTTDLWAVPFDLDDNGVINFQDLTKFVSFYGTSVVDSSSGIAWSLDFDKSGEINFQDLTFLASNYNLSKGGDEQVAFPPNFPKEWYGSEVTTDGQTPLNELIDAAVNEWRTATGNDDFTVQVLVTDLDGQQLGESHILELDENGIPIKGRVYIDDDGAGLGWYSSIEGLSFDENGQAIAGSAAEGHYDLYTVLLHEIGHAAGFTTGYSAYSDHLETTNSGQVQFVGSDFIAPLTDDGLHVDSSVYINDVMGATLDPSTRKMVSALDVQILQAAYEDAAGAVITPLGAPLMATEIAPVNSTQEVLLRTEESFAPGKTAPVKTQSTQTVAPPRIKQEEPVQSMTSTPAPEWQYVPSFVSGNFVTSFDQQDDLERLVESLIESSYETEPLLSNDFDNSDAEDDVFGFEFEDISKLKDDAEDDVVDEELDSLFSDWTGPLV